MDIFEGDGEFTLEWYFHLIPELSAEICNQTINILSKSGILMTIRPDEQLINNATIDKGWLSYKYGEKQEIVIVRFLWQGEILSRKSFQTSLLVPQV